MFKKKELSYKQIRKLKKFFQKVSIMENWNNYSYYKPLKLIWEIKKKINLL